MRGWPPAPLDPMKFPLTLAGHLRKAFNEVVSSPLPQKLAELVRRVESDETNNQSKPAGRKVGLQIDSRVEAKEKRPAHILDDQAAQR